MRFTGAGKTQIDAGVSLTASSFTQGVLEISGRAAVRPNGGTSAMSYLDSLSLISAGSLDLNDNDLVINSGAFTTIQSMVISGYRSSPDPLATGIVSTTSQNTGGSTILALFDNALVGVSDWPSASGATVSANSIIGKYTYFGDVSFDGQVTGDDYAVIDANLGTTPRPGVSWLAGDANLDGQVTGDDYGVIDANLSLGAGNPLSLSDLHVPEPATLSLLTLGVLLSRRRRCDPTKQ